MTLPNGPIFERISAEYYALSREGSRITLRGNQYQVGAYLKEQDAYLLTYLGPAEPRKRIFDCSQPPDAGPAA